MTKITKHEVITFRVEPELDKRIEDLSRERSEPKSEIIREAILEFTQKEAELKEVKSFIAKRFAAGKISFEEMVRIIGYREARKVAAYVELAKQSIQSGLG